jgi:hypothetical protein
MDKTIRGLGVIPGEKYDYKLIGTNIIKFLDIMAPGFAVNFTDQTFLNDFVYLVETKCLSHNELDTFLDNIEFKFVYDEYFALYFHRVVYQFIEEFNNNTAKYEEFCEELNRINDCGFRYGNNSESNYNTMFNDLTQLKKENINIKPIEMTDEFINQELAKAYKNEIKELNLKYKLEDSEFHKSQDQYDLYN